MAERRKIAAVISTYFPASHADVIVTKFVRGFPTDEGLLPPEVDVVSMYMDQVSDRDVGLALARAHDIPVYESIPGALCLGGKELAVDGVLAIGEHGDYAYNERGQQLYPRRFFVEQICGVISTAHRPVPVFCDKHLSYSWADASWMCDRARELGVPFMAGSSVPLFWRDPWLEHPLGVRLDEALVISYGGIEAYGYHGFEALQAMLERRQGGETGIAAVQCLEGEAVWEAGRQGRWSLPLAEAAYAVVSRGDSAPASVLQAGEEPAVFLLEYRDGLRAAVLQLNGYAGDVRGWAYAASVGGAIQATGLHSHGEPYPHFSYMSLNIQRMFVTGRPQYPVERTLLVSGALDALMESRFCGHARLETPHLDVAYAAPSEPPIRPMGRRPVGASTVPFGP